MIVLGEFALVRMKNVRKLSKIELSGADRNDVVNLHQELERCIIKHLIRSGCM